MNLVSCNGCGVVLDKDKLQFPNEADAWTYSTETTFDELDESKVVWYNDKSYLFVACPVCNGPILGESV